ncbi:phosphoglycolate phosphatase [Thermoplasma sp.]|uniref:phosphoglycolate phosphatase n=1 Tax=Thermoplasma sp. TaxID=1973142 RepID=UPI00128A476F|nr:phosphoglycolate phosphatase [Thermoplasma sp.]KAA8922687.1 MAG: phosphoglycolate phosphatase [Thermoplasma sp.]
MIRLAAIDVDGTLTDKDRLISTAAIESIRAAERNGLIVSLLSGNVIPVVYALKIFLGINGPVFGENGGIMFDNDGSIQKFFSNDETNRFLEEMSKKTSMRSILTNRWREASTGFDIDPKDVDYVRKEAESRGLVIFYSGYSWHLMNRGEDKAFAVNKLREKYSLGYDEILVIGDSNNDMPMFQLPVRKACPANATENIKAMSDFISDYSYGEEIGQIFDHFGLI